MDLDLGNKTVLNVKVNGESYKMRLPNTIEVQKFSEAIEASGDKAQVSLFEGLCVDLGLPKDVVESLDVLQLRKLTDGILEVSEKK